MRELKDWQIKAALCLVLLITFAIIASLLWGFSKITALESQLTAQHEAEYVTCDLCGRELERDTGEKVSVFYELACKWGKPAGGQWEYVGAETIWVRPDKCLCPGCAKALRTQLGGTE